MWKPKGHSLANGSSKCCTDFENRDENARRYRHRRTYDGKDELESNPTLSIDCIHNIPLYASSLKER